jgi:hypothetical protein
MVEKFEYLSAMCRQRSRLGERVSILKKSFSSRPTA